MRGRTETQGPMFLLINVEAELPQVTVTVTRPRSFCCNPTSLARSVKHWLADSSQHPSRCEWRLKSAAGAGAGRRTTPWPS
jgi:hypothetical protein